MAIFLSCSKLGSDYKHKWMQYQHLYTYIGSISQISVIDRPLTDFEQLLIQEQRLAHNLSLIYKLLIPSGSLNELTYMRKWEAEIGRLILLSEWKKAFLLTHKLSLAGKHQERNYKIMIKWYWSLVDLHNVNGDNPETCWRCPNDRVTNVHIWYCCPMVREFWLKIFHIYQKITKSDIQSNISISILSIIPGSMKAIRADILHHMLTATRTIIA